MKLLRFLSILLIGIGIALTITALVNSIRQGVNPYNFLLPLSLILMLCGALLIYRKELDQAEREIEMEEAEIQELKKMEEPEEKEGGVKKWRLRDLDYRIRRLEKKEEIK